MTGLFAFLGMPKLNKQLEINLFAHIYRLSFSSFSTARIGHTGMKVDEILENIIAAAKVIDNKLPKVLLIALQTNRFILQPYFYIIYWFCFCRNGKM